MEISDYDPPFEFLLELAQDWQTPDSIWIACDPYKASLTTVDPSPADKRRIPLTKQVFLELHADNETQIVDWGRIELCQYCPRTAYPPEKIEEDVQSREYFDSVMEKQVMRAMEVLGNPAIAGIDNESWRFGHVLWPTPTGFIAIAQTRYLDLYAYDLSIRLRYTDKPLPKKIKDFTEWYCQFDF